MLCAASQYQAQLLSIDFRLFLPQQFPVFLIRQISILKVILTFHCCLILNLGIWLLLQDICSLAVMAMKEMYLQSQATMFSIAFLVRIKIEEEFQISLVKCQPDHLQIKLYWSILCEFQVLHLSCLSLCLHLQNQFVPWFKLLFSLIFLTFTFQDYFLMNVRQSPCFLRWIHWYGFVEPLNLFKIFKEALDVDLTKVLCG